MDHASFGRPKRHTFGQFALFTALLVILMWPVFWSGGPLVFSDTDSYFRAGAFAIDVLLAAVEDVLPGQPQTSEGPTSDATLSRDDGRSASGLRSLPFSVFLNLSMRGFGVLAPLIVMSATVAGLLMIFVRHLSIEKQAIVCIGTVSLTLLPAYSALLMPDVFAGIMLLITMILILHSDLGPKTVFALLAIKLLAILTHYSHLPLGLTSCFLLGVIYWRRRNWRCGLAMFSPILLALLTNISISVMAASVSSNDQTPSGAENTISTVSITPGRYPILLARSLEDGPALRFLYETCPESGFTICEVYRDLPLGIGEVLWGPNSLYYQTTPEQMAKILNEERSLLWETFKTYPLDQTKALTKNGLTQFFLFRYPSIQSARVSIENKGELSIDIQHKLNPQNMGFLSSVQLGAVILSALTLLLYYSASSTPLRLAFWVLFVCLCANAIVCGGLSAPVSRYQGRIIWCVVLLALTVLMSQPAVSKEQKKSRMGQ